MSILNTATNESHFRLIDVRGDPRYAGFQLHRRLEKIHAISADTAIVALNAVQSYTSPKADRQSYLGTFIQSWLTPKVDDEDAVSIEQVLTKVKPIGNADSLTNPVKGYGRNIYNPFGLGRGTVDNIVYSYPYLLPSKDTLCMAIADATLEAKCTLSGTWDLVDRKTTIDKEDHTMTFWCEFRKVTWNRGWNNKTRMSVNDSGGFNLWETHEVTGVAKDSSATVFAKAQVSDNVATRVVTATDLTERDNGEVVIGRKQKRIYSGTTAAHAVFFEGKTAADGHDRKGKRVWWRRTDTATDKLVDTGGQALANFTGHDGVAYTHLSYALRDEGDGAFTVFQDGISYAGSARAVPSAQSTINCFRLESKIYYDNAKGTNQNVYVVRTDRKITSSKTTGASFADSWIAANPPPNTRNNENPITKAKLGWVDYDAEYDLFKAYRVSIYEYDKVAKTPTYLTVANYAGA